MPSLTDLNNFGGNAWGAPYGVLGNAGCFIYREPGEYSGHAPGEPSFHFALIRQWQGDAWGAEAVVGAQPPAWYGVTSFYIIPDPPEAGSSAM